MCVDNFKYFQTRSEPVYPKMLLLIAKTIIQDIVVKKNQIFTDYWQIKLLIYLTFTNLFCLLNITIYNKDKVETVFTDCSNFLELFEFFSLNADTIVSCITKKFEELQIEISNLKTFAPDGASIKRASKMVV